MPEEIKRTTGERGAPDVNFDFLNVISDVNQTEASALSRQQQGQFNDLSSILSNVNVLVKDTRKRKRDTEITYSQQFNDLANQSDQIRQQAVEAAADPFNELKAIFTDTPSMDEWAARHNAVTNQINRLRRQYAADQSAYNFEMTEIAHEIQFARQRLALTRENIAGVTAASQAVVSQVQARSAQFGQQLSTMLLPDLKEELADPEGQIPKGMVRDRILLIESAMADAKKARSAAGKSLLERKKLEFEVLTKFPELLSEDAINAALIGEKTVAEPFTGITITPQIAESVQTFQQQKQQERAAVLAGITENSIAGAQAFGQSVSILERTSGPGVDIFARDESGLPVGFDADKLPAEMRQIASVMSDLTTQARTIDSTLQMAEIEGTDLNDELRERMVVMKGELNRRAQDLRDELVKLAKENAQSGMKGKEAKEAVGQWVEFGVMRNETGAVQVLTENSASAIPGLDTSATHGIGWGAGMEVFGTKFKTEFDAAVANEPELFGEDAEDLDSGALLAAILKGNVPASQAGNLATSRALRELNERGQNKIADVVLNDWYETAINAGIRSMMQNHAGEQQTIQALDGLILGNIALSPDVTQRRDENGKLLDGINVLFVSLAQMQKQLQETGALPAEADLVNEFKTLMLTGEFYQSPEIRNLTKTKTEAAASLNRVIFNNRAHEHLMSGLVKVIRSVPVANISDAQEFQELKAFVGTQSFGNLSAEEQRAKRERLLELQQSIGDETSLFSTLKQLQKPE